MSLVLPWLWVVFTLVAAAAQTARNALQRDLTETLGTAGATHVRFLFGLPFALLFLAAVLAATGEPVPEPNWPFLGWTAFGGLAQIAATALMLAAMRRRSFVVATAYLKTEPVQVALFAFVFLGEVLSPLGILAVFVATGGVMLMSWPRGASAEERSLAPALTGIAAGGLFALAAVGFRGGIRALDHPSFVLAATTTLAVGLGLQAALIATWLGLREPRLLGAILGLWRRSLAAGFLGAFASQFWFLAFALESAARVRTLALVEVLFALLVSRRLKQALGVREIAGIVLVIGGVVLLLNG